MLGRASHVYNGFVRSRLRNEIGRTVLCGDPEEHVKSGAGRKYMFWDSDLYRQLAQKAFLSEVGAPGSCSLFGDDPADHSEYAAQFCNEKLKFVKHGQDGRDRYFWKTAEPHDYLDATAQAFAVAASQGMSGANALPSASRPVRRRPKIVVV